MRTPADPTRPAARRDAPAPRLGRPPRPGRPTERPGTYVVDPLPFGAPFEPVSEDAEDDYDGIVPGGMWMSDERGLLVSAGPRGTYVLHPDDVVDLDFHPDTSRWGGCCGASPHRGINRVCSCGAEIAIQAGDCSGGYETRLVPDARPRGSGCVTRRRLLAS
ncbi:hypothetical protein ACGFNV_30185 [Streptomyces sp. NPDC048751]|uniref:hypothetical protein n=1 Tax=Streptomyces sp. NPDC048751 TaxID=3365591 RepID=UPI00371F7093